MKASSEKELKGWWERHLPLGEPLVSAQGVPFQVLHRGRPNGAGGPDYLDAVLRLEGGDLLRGAVEIHRHAGDWWHHGHQHDARYLGVVLHGVGDPSGRQLLLANGRVPLTLDLPSLLDKEVDRGHNELCFGVWGRWGEERCLHVLNEQGDQRFREKAQTFALALRRTDRDQVLYEGLLVGLGYSRNQAPFRQLAQRLPLTALGRYAQAQGPGEWETVLETLFLGSAGLLQPPHPATGEQTEARRETESRAWWRARGGGPLVEGASWRFDGVRPGNLPPQRLKAAARLVAQWGTSGWVDWACQVLKDGPLEKGPLRLMADLQCASKTLGRGTAAVLVVNVVLPLLQANGERRRPPETSAQADWPQEAYRHCPQLPANAITHLMEARLRGGDARPPGGLACNARQHQGLIRLYKAFCAQGCGPGCPLGDGHGWGKDQ